MFWPRLPYDGKPCAGTGVCGVRYMCRCTCARTAYGYPVVEVAKGGRDRQERWHVPHGLALHTAAAAADGQPARIVLGHTMCLARGTGLCPTPRLFCKRLPNTCRDKYNCSPTVAHAVPFRTPSSQEVPIRVKTGITLRPERGVWVTVRQRGSLDGPA